MAVISCPAFTGWCEVKYKTLNFWQYLCAFCFLSLNKAIFCHSNKNFQCIFFKLSFLKYEKRKSSIDKKKNVRHREIKSLNHHLIDYSGHRDRKILWFLNYVTVCPRSRVHLFMVNKLFKKIAMSLNTL